MITEEHNNKNLLKKVIVIVFIIIIAIIIWYLLSQKHTIAPVDFQWSLEAHTNPNKIVLLCLNTDRLDGGLCDSSGYINGIGALGYCQNLNENGYSDWRLPTLTELSDAYNTRKVINNIPSSYDKQVELNDFHQDLIYWSSTISKDGRNKMAFDFHYGESNSMAGDNRNAVRCIRP